MDVKWLMEIAGTYGIFCALFLFLLVYQIRLNSAMMNKAELREKEIVAKAEEREKRLLDIIEGYKATLEGYKTELTRLTDSINRLYDRLYDKNN